MTTEDHWNESKNLLCVRPDNLGDVLMTTPAIRALKQSVPGRRITLLTSRAGQAIARFIPEIDECLVFDAPWYKHDAPHTGPELEKTVREISSHRFDGAVLFTVFSQSPLPTAMLCYLAGVPRVAAYCRENPYGLISDWLVDEEPLYTVRHEVRRQLDLVEHLGARSGDDALSLSVPPRTLARLPARLRLMGVRVDEPWLVMHTGASEAKRRYPAEAFAQAAGEIARELGYQVLLTGVRAERETAECIARSAGEKAFSLAGVLGLDELIALIKLSPLLISNNTGPVHIAAAVGTPVVVLYALTNPQHTPWKIRHRVLAFDTPRELASRNVMVRYAGEQYFPARPAAVPPENIVEAVRDILPAGDGETLPDAPLQTGGERWDVHAAFGKSR